MKTRFTTVDIRATIAELQQYLGMRVANVYDIDNRTYLIKLAKPDFKVTLLLESGNRLHGTEFEWPKNITPSGFSMKMRKHLRSRRLEKVEQLGLDRIVDLQFGSGEAAYHVILELYDRGNITLTDYEYVILNILRPRTDESQDVRYAVREKYPVETAKQPEGVIQEERLRGILLAGKKGDNLKKLLNPQLVYGPALIEHSLLEAGFPSNTCLGKEFKLEDDLPRLMTALHQAEGLLQVAGTERKGYILQKVEKKGGKTENKEDDLLTYNEFHPMLYKQHEQERFIEFESFGKAVDEFFSKLGSQKLDMKAVQQEKQALKKLENVKRDHEKRLASLQGEQATDMRRAQLIEMNLHLVDRALMIVQSALANQIDWSEINQIVKEAQAQGDPVASSIKGLKLESNHITMLLKEPFIDSEDDEDDSAVDRKPLKVDIDLGLTAYANARKFYDMKRHAAKKEQKTLESSGKALKSAEKKTKQTLKDVATAVSINKARKTYWFEKFLWFISSENYLVIGGRDSQQNELIVKRHLRPGDLYVHADLHGASSVILKNPSGEVVSPKTLNEAGTMAVCNSAAWDAKVYTSAWWVYHHQVSKTAPTGEYLTTGSFMIRGKKNFLPPCYQVYGFSFLFKLDEDSVFRHKDERRVRTADDDASSITNSATAESEMSELMIESDDDDSESDDNDGEEDSREDHRLDDINETGEEEQTGLGEGAMKTENSEETTDSTEKWEDIKTMDGPVKPDNLETTVSTVKHEHSETTSRTEDLVEDNEDEMKKEEVQSDEDDSQDEFQFPDTSIQLQHIKGDKFTLQRNVSQVSTDSDVIELGDGVPIVLSTDRPQKAGSKLSAKQRREMRKARQGKHQPAQTSDDTGGENNTSDLTHTDNQALTDTVSNQALTDNASQSKGQQQAEKVIKQPQQPQQQPKRGQKAKLKKLKEKYADQDDEERSLRMEILASAGPQKEKKKKKGKKGKQEKEKPAGGRLVTGPGGTPGRPPGRPPGRLTIEDLKEETLTMEEAEKRQSEVKAKIVRRDEDEDALSDEERQAFLEEENIRVAEDASTLDSLTGVPVGEEDGLLFTIPVCAPYTALVNYKYKVKLTPGNTKRGKAVKTAVNMFLHDRSMSARERELLRSVKDSDLSRNLPGKVKVSAPNLHKQKHK